MDYRPGLQGQQQEKLENASYNEEFIRKEKKEFGWGLLDKSEDAPWKDCWLTLYFSGRGTAWLRCSVGPVLSVPGWYYTAGLI